MSRMHGNEKLVTLTVVTKVEAQLEGVYAVRYLPTMFLLF